MSFTQGLDRRDWLKLAASGALSGLPGLATAQPKGKVTVFFFPGGTAEAFQEFYCTPYQQATGSEIRLAMPPGNPLVWFKTRKKEFNVSIANPTALLQYRDGDLEPITEAEFPNLKAVPERFRTPTGDGAYTSMPIYYQFYGIAINTDHCKPSDFRSWSDLANPKWKGKIGVGNYADLYELPFFARMLSRNESTLDPALELYKKILANCLTIPRTLVQANQMLRSGEIVAMPYYSAQVSILRGQGANNLQMLVPQEGAMIIPYSLAISKDSPDLPTVKHFVNYCGALPNAAAMAAKTGFLPVSSNVSMPSNVEALTGVTRKDLDERLVSLDWAKISNNMQQWSEIVKQANASVR